MFKTFLIQINKQDRRSYSAKGECVRKDSEVNHIFKIK